MYAVFHSPTYRQRYSEFLKTDFPRLPLTSQPKLFKQLCELGDKLIELHLMEEHGEDIAGYPIEGDNVLLQFFSFLFRLQLALPKSTYKSLLPHCSFRESLVIFQPSLIQQRQNFIYQMA